MNFQSVFNATCRRSISIRHLRLLILGFATASLSACSWVGVLATEGPLSLTERRGLQSFTLVAELPAQFGLGVTGWYSPRDESRLNCQVTNLHTNKPQARYLGKNFNVEVTAQAELAKRSIPLTYYVGACALELTQVQMKIRGRYGEQSRQKTYADSVFYVLKRTPKDEPGFDTSGTRRVSSQCTWLFQESKLHLELSKLLMCKGAGANLQYDQLAGKTVTLAIEINPEEKPAYDNSWIKFPQGWKPCTHEPGGWIWCKKPPTFQTFQMNGQTCTVYPGCTE